MPPTIDTSRMSVEQMRALSAEKQHERQGKKEREAREWSRCADQLEAALMQGFPATWLTDGEESGFPKEVDVILRGTTDAVAQETYTKCWNAVDEALGIMRRELAASPPLRFPPGSEEALGLPP